MVGTVFCIVTYSSIPNTPPQQIYEVTMSEEKEENMGDVLPRDFISTALTLTTPRDVCRASLVSTTFESAASADPVWERFLPPDYAAILSLAVSQVEFASKKELYFRLCDSILIDRGTKSFSLVRTTGKKCFMLGPRELGMIWGSEPQYWRFATDPDSSPYFQDCVRNCGLRMPDHEAICTLGFLIMVGFFINRFGEASELIEVCWLHIFCKFTESVYLSPETNYAAYFVFKLNEESSGFSYPAQRTSVSVGQNVSRNNVCLQIEELERLPQVVGVPNQRDDGWLEIEMGEFFNVMGNTNPVCMNFTQFEEMNWKRSLIIQGIELRPKN